MLCIRKLLNAAMVGLIIIGILLRFVFLFIAFEYDELFTVITVNPVLPLYDIIQNWLLIDVHPPLYNILLYFYNCIYYIQAEWWIRLPSLGCALLSVWVSWRLFPRGLGSSARWIFVGLFACSLQLLIFAPQARSYSLLVLLALLHMLASLNIWRRIWNNELIPLSVWLAWSVTGLLLGYTHYFGVAVFCAGSILLGAGLCWRKKKPTAFLLCFAVVFGLICLWMIPNFISNWEQQRFAGNWWAAEYEWTDGVFQLARFIFGNYSIYLFICGVCLCSLVWDARKAARCQKVPFLAEKVFLFGVISLVVLTVFVLSLKIYLIVPRFYLVLFPYIYLFVALSAARLVSRSLLARGMLVLICGWNVCAFGHLAALRYAHMPDNAKEYSAYFLKYHPGKELFVFVLDGLPVPAMQPMFSYYIQEYYGRKDIPVTVLNSFSVQSMKKLLREHPQAVIWLPNCDLDKIKRLQSWTGIAWKREKDIGYHCELTASPAAASVSEGTVKPFFSTAESSIKGTT